MNNLDKNTTSALQNSVYYDELWPKLGTKLHYTEFSRIQFITECIQELATVKPVKILDLGCGRGWMAPFLVPYGNVVGIDFSPIGIQFAKENYGQFADFYLAKDFIPSEVYDKGLFDFVVSSEVIEHVPDPNEFVAQAVSYLRDGGWLILTTPNGNVWEKFKNDKRFQSQLQPIENWVTTMDLVELLTKAGLDIFRHEGRPLYQFRIGISGLLQFRFVQRIFQTMNRTKLYGRLILSTALYQMIAAQKRNCN